MLCRLLPHDTATLCTHIHTLCKFTSSQPPAPTNNQTHRMQYAGPSSKQITATQSTVDTRKHTLAPPHIYTHTCPCRQQGGRLPPHVYATTTQPLWRQSTPMQRLQMPPEHTRCSTCPSKQRSTSQQGSITHTQNTHIHACVHAYTPAPSHKHQTLMLQGMSHD